MRIGQLQAGPALADTALLAPPVAAALRAWTAADRVGLVRIDPQLADTAAFCARYGVSADDSANCVVVSARRGETTRLAACVLLASTRAEVNTVVRRQLDARKVSFAPMELAVAESGMAYGAITPVGLPPAWPLLIDAAVVGRPLVVIGSGVRHSKLLLPGSALAELPGAVVLDGLARPLA